MIRGLTPGEAALALEVFGDALDPARVRILAAPWPFVRAFVAGRWFGRDWIIWPRRTLPDDLALGPLFRQATLVHELAHVWQVARGVNLLTGKLRAGDRPAAYEYPMDAGCDWDALNIEQQAMIIEHRFRLSRGGSVPAERAFYDRICPLAHRMEI
ncbi:hypothetical protein [uncultured Brevundimonas sp.]|uniref:hypothetical protein n=1 Tax=uncultured Brevundimonas sp. TaxID=213418 RepID=UPI0030EDFCB9